MNFLCLVHIDQAQLDALTPEERVGLERENAAYYDWLVANGHNRLSSSLHAPETATVIRSHNGRVSMTDGPYVETKEHVGGFMLLSARDREEALAAAARSPVARYGAIELREIHNQEL